MASKSMKPSVPARPKPLTEEEKQEQIARFLSQKRESFALSFFAGLSRSRAALKAKPEAVAKQAVACADALMEQLYPIARRMGEEAPSK